jgi:hypothetical protein
MARFVRVLRALPSVVTIALGILAAVRSVMSTFYILGFELFCVAVVFRARFGGPPYDGPPETEDEFFARTADDGLIYKFRTVNESFFACLFAGVFTDNITLVMGELSRKSSPMMVVFFFHVILTNLTLLNILVGVVCAVIHEATEAQKDRVQLKNVKELMLKHLEEVDENKNMMIGPSEFKELLAIPDVVDFLENECSISSKEMALMAETMFYDSKNPGHYKELTFTALLQAILSLRDGKPSTAVDILALQREIKQVGADIADMKSAKQELTAKVDNLCSLLKDQDFKKGEQRATTPLSATSSPFSDKTMTPPRYSVSAVPRGRRTQESHSPNGRRLQRRATRE